jgi:general secretion pathway protein D
MRLVIAGVAIAIALGSQGVAAGDQSSAQIAEQQQRELEVQRVLTERLRELEAQLKSHRALQADTERRAEQQARMTALLRELQARQAAAAASVDRAQTVEQQREAEKRQLAEQARQMDVLLREYREQLRQREARAADAQAQKERLLELRAKLMAMERELAARLNREHQAPESQLPALDSAALNKPITVIFRNAEVRDILESLAQSAGMTVRMAEGVEARMLVSIQFRDVPVREVLNYMLGVAGLNAAVVDEKTLLITRRDQ